LKYSTDGSSRSGWGYRGLADLAGLIGKGGFGFEGGGLSEGGAVGGNGRVEPDGLGNTLGFGYTLFVLLCPEFESWMDLNLGNSDVVEVRGATFSFAREDPMSTFAISFAIASMSASEYPGIGSSVFAFSFPFPFTVTGGLTTLSVI